MRLARLLFLFSACLLGPATASCNGCSKKGPDLSAPVVETPVAAPASLLAEMTIENPDAFWGKLQKGMGGLAGLMPASAGGIVTSLTSLDPALAPVVDGASPAYAAFVGSPYERRWALALRLTDLPHARQASFDAPAAKYAPTDDGDFVLLAPKVPPVPGTPVPFTFAISKTGYLVVARTKADIDEVGPYLVRTMPSHPRATSDVALDIPHTALAGPIHDGVLAKWNDIKQTLEASAKKETEAHGRAADLADPAGILAASDQSAQKILAEIADVANVHVTVQANGDLLDAEAIVTPGDPSGPAAQWLSARNHGDPSPLLDAPQGLLGVFWQTSAADRASLPGDGEQFLRQVFGQRLNETEMTSARQSLTDWASGVGDHTVLTAAEAPLKTLSLHTPTTHPDALAKATRAALELLGKALQDKGLKRFLGDCTVSFGTEDVVGVGKAQTMKVDRHPGDPLSAAWATQNGVFGLVFAGDASAALGVKENKDGVWKDDARIVACATAAGPGTSVALAGKPLDDKSVFFFGSFGVQSGRGRATLTVSDVLVREEATNTAD